MNAPDLNDASEFTRFYRTHLPTVYGYLFRLCGNDRTAAEDLTQDTWMALAKEVRRGNTGCADIRWLLTVARSRFLDDARREQRGARKLALVGPRTEPDEPPEAHEVMAELGSLQPLHRLVLVLRYVEDMPVPAVADTIGRNVMATNSLLARARKELRHSLGAHR
jgi:RNA polymerase sigma-70 factor, ECF subfamily